VEVPIPGDPPLARSKVEAGADLLHYYICSEAYNFTFDQTNFLRGKYSVSDYRALVYPDFHHPRWDLPHLFNGKTHADFVFHELSSHMVAYALLQELLHNPSKESCEIPVKIHTP
jgi:hypothetical protein